MMDINPQASYDKLRTEQAANLGDPAQVRELTGTARNLFSGEEVPTTFCIALSRLWMVNGDLRRAQELYWSEDTSVKSDHFAETAAEACGGFDSILGRMLREPVGAAEVSV